MCTHSLCFGKKYEKYRNFLSENFPFLVVKFSMYLNRCVIKIFSYYLARGFLSIPTTYFLWRNENHTNTFGVKKHFFWR